MGYSSRGKRNERWTGGMSGGQQYITKTDNFSKHQRAPEHRKGMNMPKINTDHAQLVLFHRVEVEVGDRRRSERSSVDSWSCSAVD